MNRQNEGGLSWYFGDDDDLDSIQDIPDYNDKTSAEEEDLNGYIDGAGNDYENENVEENDSNSYSPSPTPSKHYYSHRRNESDNVSRLFRSSNDLRSSHENVDKYGSNYGVDTESEYAGNKSVYSSEDEEYNHSDRTNDYNQVLHKYGMHRDETRHRSEKLK